MKIAFTSPLWTAGSSLAWVLLLAALSASAQNLFVADKGSGNIYQYTHGGERSTFASGLNSPFGLAFDSEGNLYVTSLAGGSITKFTPSGAQSTFASGLTEPCGLAFDSEGDLFVAQAGYTRGGIVEISPNGIKRVFASRLVNPETLVFDGADNLFVQSPGWGSDQGYITKITPVGTQSTFASGLNFPGGLAFDDAGNFCGFFVGVDRLHQVDLNRMHAAAQSADIFVDVFALADKSALHGQAKNIHPE